MEETVQIYDGLAANYIETGTGHLDIRSQEIAGERNSRALKQRGEGGLMSFYQEDHATEALPVGAPFERHFYIREIAKLWGFSNDMVRRIFENEPGVIRVGDTEKLHKRRYVSLRVPENVMRRVHRRLTTTTGKPV